MTSEPTQKPTAQEFMGSITGYDEIAIYKFFNEDWAAMAQHRAGMLARAMVFVAKRREGMKDAEAYKAVIEMPLQAVRDYWADEPEEVFPEEPVTEAGKD